MSACTAATCGAARPGNVWRTPGGWLCAGPSGVRRAVEGGRHTGNSLMYDAENRPGLVMGRAGHASQEMSQQFHHPERQAHLTASARVTALVSGAGNGS